MKQVCPLVVVILTLGTAYAEDRPPSFNPVERLYIIGTGQGDLSKGRIVCERVAELAARADVAKQIQVQVKEQIRDRVHERTGRDIEQDIEIVREEHVSEWLKGVRIVERTVDPATGICSSKAILSKDGAAHDP